MPRRPAVLALVLVAGLALSACGDDPAPSAAQEAQVRAQAGLLQSYNATYTVKDAKGADGQRVTVWRTPTTLRLDVKTSGGVSTSITTPERTVACQAPENGKAPTCLVVAGAGQTPAPAFDPTLRKVFGDALRVLANTDTGLTIDEQAGTASPGPTTAAGETARCFDVTAPATLTTKIASGTYCLTTDGIPTGMSFPSGSATLSLLKRTTPPPTVFVPTTSPSALPKS